MTVLDIIKEGDPRLRQKAHRIRNPEPGLKAIAADMHETMDAAPGVGLAGPQVGLMRRIIVVHLPEDYVDEGSPDLRMTLLNPEIVKGRGEEVGRWNFVRAWPAKYTGPAFNAEGIYVAIETLEFAHEGVRRV